MIDNLENLRCPECNSDQVYTRVMTQERVCKKCGHVWKVKGGQK